MVYDDEACWRVFLPQQFLLFVFFWGYKGFTPYCRLHKGEFFPPYTEEDAFSSLVAFHSHIF